MKPTDQDVSELEPKRQRKSDSKLRTAGSQLSSSLTVPTFVAIRGGAGLHRAQAPNNLHNGFWLRTAEEA